MDKWRKTTKGKFYEMRHNARKRGIPFLLTYEEWISIWGDYLDKRGRGFGKYVMARPGDKGPYEKGNVYIITAKQNSADGGRLGKIQSMKTIKMEK